MTTKRVESLDWLRGLMAISIMLYHLTGWIYYPLDASSLLGKLGVYGVSIFFILSGLSMAIVYNTFIQNIETTIKFYIRRVFRIWPLLWVCIILVIAPNLIKHGDFDYIKIISNMTTAFGFYNPTGYINTGAWSIGNEMVYYAFTPFMIFLYAKQKILGDIFLIITFFIYCFFALVVLDKHLLLSQQWSLYVNPFNNLFLYCAGLSIYYNLKNYVFKSWHSCMLILISSLLFLIPISGDTINIVTGVNRFFFTVASIFLVVGFYKFNQYYLLPKSIKMVLEKFGIATYGVYLFHPIVNMYWVFFLKQINFLNLELQFIGTIIFTIIAALVSYYFIETRLIKIGKKITA